MASSSISITLLDNNSESDLFTMHTSSRQPRRRRSSHFNRWLKDQQQNLPVDGLTEPINIANSIPEPANSSQCHPYLAYPHLSNLSLNPPLPLGDEDVSQSGYDLVEDSDIPENPRSKAVPATPNRASKSSDHHNTASTLRKLHLAFRSSSGTASSPSPSKMFFHRNASPSPSTPSKSHNRSTSLSTLTLSKLGSSNSNSGTVSSSWKWRPSVLGHFSSPSVPAAIVPPNKTDCQITLSRPSLSSSSTYTPTATVTTEDESLLTPPKLSSTASTSSYGFIGSTRSFLNTGIGSSSSYSLWAPSSQHHETPSEVGSNHALGHKASTIRVPSTSSAPMTLEQSQMYAFSNESSSDCDEPRRSDPGPIAAKGHDPTKPFVEFSLNKSRVTLPRVSLSSITSSTKSKPKRILVISGVGVNDSRKFEGIRKWCESFGEVSLITRMPNGDLQVHFQRAEVADMVCRLRAKVFISGVGSVYVSWCTCKKRQLLP